MITFKQYLAEIAIKGKAVKMTKAQEIIDKAKELDLPFLHKEFTSDIDTFIGQLVYIIDQYEELPELYVDGEIEITRDALKHAEEVFKELNKS